MLGEWKIRFKFIYDTKKIDISFYNKILEKKITFSIHYKYDVETKIVTENVDFFDNTKKCQKQELKTSRR